MASGRPWTNRIELATCKLGCLFHFPVDVAFCAPPRLHKAVLSFMKAQCSFQSNHRLPGSSLCGSRALKAGVQDTVSSEENCFCAAKTGPEWVTGGLSEGVGEPSSFYTLPSWVAKDPSSSQMLSLLDDLNSQSW